MDRTFPVWLSSQEIHWKRLSNAIDVTSEWIALQARLRCTCQVARLWHRLTAFTIMPSMQGLREQIHDEDAYELNDYRKRMKESKSYGDATSDDGEHVVTRVRTSSESSAASDVCMRPYTAEEERKVRRKLDLHVVLFMSFLYMLSFLDRSSTYLSFSLQDHGLAIPSKIPLATHTATDSGV